MNIGIGAIFKDEFGYILEWLAWHRIAGFSHFFIADNSSSDGTRQLLEALSVAGLIRLFHIPPQPNAQVIAYMAFQEQAKGAVEAIAFIDADEFIYSDDNLKPTEHLTSYFSNPKVGAVGINWKTFGSSGHLEQLPGLVTERFTQASHDSFSVNLHIKSIVRPELIKYLGSVHHFNIPKQYLYLNSAGKPIVSLNSLQQPVDTRTAFSEVIPSPLRIYHYAVKSLQEFTEKKRKRGDALKSPTHDRGEAYFKLHDRNEESVTTLSNQAPEINREISRIKGTLKDKTDFFKKVKGVVGSCTSSQLVGWCAIESEATAKIQIFVNGNLYKTLDANIPRPDVAAAGFSKTGVCGFKLDFVPALKSGDVVDISLYGNRFNFKQPRWIIE